MLGQGGSSVYSDIEGIQDLLRYPCICTGGCSVAEHPTFGHHCYPSTIFVACSLDELKRAIGNATESCNF